MGLSYSEFQTSYNNEYYDRFDYPSPEIDPFVTDAENKTNYKNPVLSDYGTGLSVYRRKHDFLAGQQKDAPQGIAFGGTQEVAYRDSVFHKIQATHLQHAFVSYTSRKAFECIHTYGDAAPRFCENELKRHLLLTDREARWKFGSLSIQHNIDPIAHIPKHLSYESDEFKDWLEQNAMSFIFPLYLADYVQELNDY